MAKDPRNLLTVLKAELEFLEKGGYRNPSRAKWRPQFAFEDSPTCLNYRDPARRKPCTECVLIDLVPKECRENKIPCRHIPLNVKAETVDSLYRTGTQEELEVALAIWLKSRRRERAQISEAGARPERMLSQNAVRPRTIKRCQPLEE